MSEPYRIWTVQRILTDCGYDPANFNIKASINEFTVSYLGIDEYKRLNAQLSPDEQEWLKDKYVFSPGYSYYYLSKRDFTDDEKTLLTKAFKQAGIIVDNATVINILPSYFK